MGIKIRFRLGDDGMVIVLVGDAISFAIHPSLRHYPESLKAIIAGEVDDYSKARWRNL